MKSFIERIMNTTKHYNVLDFAMLKTSLISLGILLGAYFSKFFLCYTTVLWIIFTISYVFIMYKTFFKYMKQ